MKQRYVDLLAIAGVFAAYSITIRFALQAGPGESLLGGLANTIPVVIFGAMVRRITLRKLIGKPAALQLLAHLPLCVVFCALSYGLLIVLLGLLFGGRGLSGFLVKPFSIGGTAWQSLENVTTYALIAAMSYLQAQYGRPLSIPTQPGMTSGARQPAPDCAVVAGTASPEDIGVQGGDANPELSRYFVRIGDELRPIDIDSVVSIGGADDYAEVRTLSGKHLVRMTLAEFTRSLDPAKYARVHRSWIVNVHRIARAEPAGGGRLLLHMETGQIIATSRTGARLLRDRVI